MSQNGTCPFSGRVRDRTFGMVHEHDSKTQQKVYTSASWPAPAPSAQSSRTLRTACSRHKTSSWVSSPADDHSSSQGPHPEPAEPGAARTRAARPPSPGAAPGGPEGLGEAGMCGPVPRLSHQPCKLSCLQAMEMPSSFRHVLTLTMDFVFFLILGFTRSTVGRCNFFSSLENSYSSIFL